MDAVQKLLIIEEIKQLKSRYFRSMDLKDIEMYRSLMTEDFAFDSPGIITDPVTGYSPYPDPTDQILRGRDACAEQLFAGIGHVDYCAVHLGHMPDITVIDENNATAIWSMSDVVNYPGPGGVRHTLVGFGHYNDIYRREDGVWKIAYVKLRRIRVDYPLEAEWVEMARRGHG